jgi:hypothetical protein
VSGVQAAKSRDHQSSPYAATRMWELGHCNAASAGVQQDGSGAGYLEFDHRAVQCKHEQIQGLTVPED